MPWQNNNGGGGKSPWGQPPRGGSGGPQGPDIDDLIQGFQNKLKDLMPGGGMGRLLILGVIGLAVLSVSTYRVSPSEQGIVLRFGQYVRTEPSGFHFKLPTPIETVITPQVEKQRQTDIGYRSGVTPSPRRRTPVNLTEESLMLTTDPAIIDIAFSVFWRIEDARKFLFNLEDQEDTVKAVAESAMREVVGRTRLEVAQTEGRLQIETDTLALIQQTLNEYDAGISITEVKLQKVDPPLQVIDAFKDVQAAGQDQQTYQNEAARYANQILEEAKGNADRMIQEAEAYKAEVIALATGDAARFLSVYKEYTQAKSVTRKRMYLETMEGILSGMNKIILDDKAGSGVVPYLPLPEIQARRSGGDGQ